MVQFKSSRFELKLIAEIADRAIRELPLHGYDRQTLMMDLDATHSNGCQLNLTMLLNASSIDFAHDIYGIHRHLDRDTGRLMDHFSPRYTLRAPPPPLADLNA
jgi:hypothetical protein